MTGAICCDRSLDLLCLLHCGAVALLCLLHGCGAGVSTSLNSVETSFEVSCERLLSSTALLSDFDPAFFFFKKKKKRMKRLRKSQKSCNKQRSLRSSNSIHVLEVVRHHLGCRRRGTICDRAALALQQGEGSPGSGASHKGAPPTKPAEHGGLLYEFWLRPPL